MALISLLLPLLLQAGAAPSLNLPPHRGGPPPPRRHH